MVEDGPHRPRTSRGDEVTDPRIEAAAAVLAEVTGEPRAGRFEYTMARAALAAADKAATVTTVEGLDALPAGSVVLDRFNYPHHKIAQSKPDFKNLRTGSQISRSEFYLPARVIHFGGTE